MLMDWCLQHTKLYVLPIPMSPARGSPDNKISHTAFKRPPLESGVPL